MSQKENRNKPIPLLRELLSKHFSVSELKILFDDLNSKLPIDLDFDNIPVFDQTKRGISRYLIGFINRRALTDKQKLEFLSLLKQKRENVVWDLSFYREFKIKGSTSESGSVLESQDSVMTQVIRPKLNQTNESGRVSQKKGSAITKISPGNYRVAIVLAFFAVLILGAIALFAWFSSVSTATPVPLTETATATPVPSTETATATSVPPTEAATATSVPPTEAATSTLVPPTEAATSTPVPPTKAATSTPVPPTETATSTPVSPIREDQIFYQTVIINASVDVYGGPSRENDILGRVVFGEVYPILTTVRGNAFYSILFGNGAVGWVAAEDVHIDPRIDVRAISLDPAYHGAEHGPTPTAGPVATLTPTPTLVASIPPPEPTVDVNCHAITVDLPLSDVLFGVVNPNAQTSYYWMSVEGSTVEGNPGRLVLDPERVEKSSLEGGSKYSIPNTKFTSRDSQIGTTSVVRIDAYDDQNTFVCSAKAKFTRTN